MANKIDSNVTGLRFAEESALKTLIGSPIWYPLEPNSYNDFGGNITTVARNPINKSRQRSKGAVTDLDASGGFNTDLTQKNLTRLLQSFFFANIREKFTNLPINGTQITLSNVDGTNDQYEAASGLNGTGVLVNSLLYASGFSVAANNGLKVVEAVAAGALDVAEDLTDETPAATAKIQLVGYQFASATVNVAMSGNLARLSRASGAFDFTTIGLIPGEWIFIGGDSSTLKFSTAANNGFARVKAVAATYIELDKTEGDMVNETGTGKTIQIFFGNVIKNEDGTTTSIVTKSVQLERTLGEDGSGTMSEYQEGAVANQLTLNMPTADKITMDMSFVSCDFTQRDGATGVKSGTRPALTISDAFNSTNDVRRLKMSLLDATDAYPSALFAYLTEFSLNVNNNVSPAKAIGVLGAFDITSGNFEVGGNVTAYFADIAAVTAVKNNSSVTIDAIISKSNAGMVFDIPLLTLGDGRLSVQQDQAITLPLSINAAQNDNSYTLLFNEFPYLPTLAM